MYLIYDQKLKLYYNEHLNRFVANQSEATQYQFEHQMIRVIYEYKEVYKEVTHWGYKYMELHSWEQVGLKPAFKKVFENIVFIHRY